MLAPMEGVVDFTMRALLTQIGGIDRCVTEFVRVTDQRLPPRVFYRFCPELREGGRTPSGVPVYLQLLGGRPGVMGLNAQRAAELGAPGIDINFGCPAKQVNRNDGGSVILREPERVHAITRAVREAVPPQIPVTAKIRLGYEDRSLFRDVVAAVVDAGASELTVHARTKVDGYKPPAYWSELSAVSANLPIPLIANGEVWTPSHYEDCRRQSGCADVMLGRGLLACPDLARQLKAQASVGCSQPMAWVEVLGLLVRFARITEQMYEPRHVGNRIKQWLGYLRRQYAVAAPLFEAIKRLRCPEEIIAVLQQQQTDAARRQCA
ncbi:tRNA dihydrouridine synthase [Gilvimarinus sp. F26214L]|uniref:tRNA dihydrouridine synthase n=1 Tax=Gilvimarinus sp. DZF01 TaxID=3461371 RepID=UPI004045C274